MSSEEKKLNSDVTKNNQVWLFSQSRLLKISITDKDVVNPMDFQIKDNIYNIVVNNNIMYVSGKNYLYKFSLGNFPKGGYYYKQNTIKKFTPDQEKGYYYFEEEAKKFNPNQDIILATGSENILSAQTYNGIVSIRHKDTLDQIKLYKNIDAPFKAIWSNYHLSYIVMGTNSIWKINNNISDIIFSVDGYDLKDFAINKDGNLCILISSAKTQENEAQDIIKIIDANFYKNILLSTHEYQSLKKVAVAGDYFYIIKQKSINNSNSKSYKGDSIIINTKSNSVEIIPINAIVNTQQKDPPKSTIKIIEIISPTSGDTLALNEEYSIQWLSSKSEADNVSIKLYLFDEQLLTINERTKNSGLYKWKVPNTLELSNNYKIRITWLSASNDPANYGETLNFAISDTKPPPQVAESSDYITGITYDDFTNNIILSFYSGLIGIYDFKTKKFYDLYKSGLNGIEGCAANNDQLKQFNKASKVRIFVGTDKFLNNKWDSGVVETNMKSMYYGGGNNLIPGEKYYVHIQVYSDEFGWSEVQIKEFIMPL